MPRLTLRSRLGMLAGVLRLRWQYALAREAFARLDAAAIRDLGMSRSEFDSYWVETHGLTEWTRMRVQRAKREGPHGAESR